MFVYTSSGTYNYLKKVLNQQKNENVYLFQGQDCQIWHETLAPSFFNSPQSYEVIEQFGVLTNKSMIEFKFFTTTDEGKPIFEYEIKNILPILQKANGFIALRSLRPLKGNTFLIMTMWESKKDFNHWNETDPFNTVLSTKAVFTSPAYSKIYYMNDEEIEFDE